MYYFKYDHNMLTFDTSWVNHNLMDQLCGKQSVLTKYKEILGWSET